MEAVENGIVQIAEEEESLVVALRGKIDQTNYESIQSEVFDRADKTACKKITCDLKEVTYVSSAGLRMFSALNRKAAEVEKSYQLVNVREDIAKLFSMTGYSSAFNIQELSV